VTQLCALSSPSPLSKVASTLDKVSLGLRLLATPLQLHLCFQAAHALPQVAVHEEVAGCSVQVLFHDLLLVVGLEPTSESET